MASGKITALAATFGASGVVLGAFGAHALKTVLTAAGTSALWEKAVFYHLIHAVGLLFVSHAVRDDENARWAQFAAASWTAGIVLFSGSLYGLALGGPRGLGPLTPLGGLALILGWGAIALGNLRGKPRGN